MNIRYVKSTVKTADSRCPDLSLVRRRALVPRRTATTQQSTPFRHCIPVYATLPRQRRGKLGRHGSRLGTGALRPGNGRILLAPLLLRRVARPSRYDVAVVQRLRHGRRLAASGADRAASDTTAAALALLLDVDVRSVKVGLVGLRGTLDLSSGKPPEPTVLLLGEA